MIVKRFFSSNNVKRLFSTRPIYLRPDQPEIHTLSVIHDSAIIDPSAKIGPFCTIGPNVQIGANCELKSHVVMDGFTKMGSNCIIYPHASIGTHSQDKKYKGGNTKLTIGNNCVIRESTSINCGTEEEFGGNPNGTRIGNNLLLMWGSHIGHDCDIGNDVVITSLSGLAGHVSMEDKVIIGGMCGIRQNIHIGKLAMICGASTVIKNVLPYSMIMGNPGSLRGVNLEGLRRAGIPKNQIIFLLKIQKYLFPTIVSKNSSQQYPDLPQRKFLSDRVSAVMSLINSGVVEKETTVLVEEVLHILNVNKNATTPLCEYK